MRQQCRTRNRLHDSAPRLRRLRCRRRGIVGRTRQLRHIDSVRIEIVLQRFLRRIGQRAQPVCLEMLDERGIDARLIGQLALSSIAMMSIGCLPAANSDAPLPPEHCLRRFLYAPPPFKINALRDSQSANPRLIKVNPGRPSTPELSFHCTAQAATSSATCPTNPPRTAPLTRSFAAIDYKAPEIPSTFNNLDKYRVSKTIDCKGFGALSG
ncbi:Uncharacterised protein [Burkholderia pseudomallei]|nr:hypothetical protein DP46_1511 [Burkholderia pseudomallei]AJX61442.1 hypothetical protein DP47_894 [Burkholderia pseudomallei Pasteur 52237]AIS45771.1 hypothetical protein DR61_96 [Burkholderia pseudomallei]KGD22183.1 hypothetical protein DR60_5905 [Burkholderia pseudomallei]CAJ2752637.1 Uncharacterised protein [Burkholderia pseudomallei]